MCRAGTKLDRYSTYMYICIQLLITNQNFYVMATSKKKSIKITANAKARLDAICERFGWSQYEAFEYILDGFEAANPDPRTLKPSESGSTKGISVGDKLTAFCKAIIDWNDKQAAKENPVFVHHVNNALVARETGVNPTRDVKEFFQSGNPIFEALQNSYQKHFITAGAMEKGSAYRNENGKIISDAGKAANEKQSKIIGDVLRSYGIAHLFGRE